MAEIFHHHHHMIVSNYAELDCISNFSFLRGASHPEELIERASELNLAAIGLADDNTLAGAVRAHLANKQSCVKLLIGSRLTFTDKTPTLILYPVNILGYQGLSRMLSTGKMRTKKGHCELNFSDLTEVKNHCIAIAAWQDLVDDTISTQVKRLQAHFGEHNFYVAASFLYDGFTDEQIAILKDVEKNCSVPMVATNSVIAHRRDRKALADVISCIKAGTTLETAGALLKKNSERYLKSAEEMRRLFNHCPEWLKNSVVIANRVSFSLDQLTYHYPSFTKNGHQNDQELLVEETFKGARKRYHEIPQKISHLLYEELKLVRDLGYATYFLTVYDIVNFAKSKGILCQGRGSAANSAICYCLGITEVDPNTHDLLFGRFLSKERNEPPDIDVDFENAAREEVIQYIYQKYGRTHAGLTATVITYRKRMAGSKKREVAKVFGLLTRCY